jgi:hypothetical protein
MTREEIQTTAKAWPFRPFTLVTESSALYNVEHPDYIHFPSLAESDHPEAWFGSSLCNDRRDERGNFSKLRGICQGF